ncbi:MAG: IclR family transcriptional regulator [Betaproteobacteria bacterium]|nr:MAG: IclR family transcriptional regulator [Betaproteobacteria bacterium]
MNDEIKPSDLVDGLRKGLEVILAFDDASPQMTQSELALRIDLSRAAARRYLLTLTALGYMASDGKNFWLTPKVMQLGRSFTASSRLPRTIQPELQALTERCGESTNFAVLEDTEAVYVCCANANRLLSTGIEPGTRLPAYTSTAGRLLASFLDDHALDRWIKKSAPRAHTTFTVTEPATLKREIMRMRKQAYGITESQFEPGLRGISVPLRDSANNLVGALSVSMAVSAMTASSAIKKLVPLLNETAARLAQKL